MWAWWKGTCQKRSDDQRAREGVRQTVRKRFSSLLSTLNLSSCCGRLAHRRFTHTNAPNLTCAGSIRHLSSTQLRAHTHTHLLLSHTHWTFQMGRSAIQWRWATAVEEQALRTAFSFVFLLEFLEFVHVKGLVFEHSCEEGWIRRSVSLNGLTKPWMRRRDEV